MFAAVVQVVVVVVGRLNGVDDYALILDIVCSSLYSTWVGLVW